MAASPSKQPQRLVVDPVFEKSRCRPTASALKRPARPGSAAKGRGGGLRRARRGVPAAPTMRAGRAGERRRPSVAPRVGALACGRYQRSTHADTLAPCLVPDPSDGARPGCWSSAPPSPRLGPWLRAEGHGPARGDAEAALARARRGAGASWSSSTASRAGSMRRRVRGPARGRAARRRLAARDRRLVAPAAPRTPALHAGADDYLHRPFTRAELLARVRAGVRAAQQRSDDALLRSLMVNVPGRDLPLRLARRPPAGADQRRDRAHLAATRPPTSSPAPSARWSSIVHPDDRERILEAVEHAAEDHDRPFVARVPDRPRRRRDPLGARPRPAGPRARAGGCGWTARCSTSPSAARPRTRCGGARSRRARTEELHASRARIVEAADDARRKIERDLHDGAQQRLVSLGARRAGGPPRGWPRTRSRPGRSSTAWARSSRRRRPSCASWPAASTPRC